MQLNSSRLRMSGLSALLIALLPSVALAKTFGNIVDQLVGVINTAIPVVGGLILLAFLWGIFKYIFSSADSTEKSQGKEIIVWGLVALFVAFSIWGLVEVLQSTIIR